LANIFIFLHIIYHLMGITVHHIPLPLWACSTTHPLCDYHISRHIKGEQPTVAPRWQCSLLSISSLYLPYSTYWNRLVRHIHRQQYLLTLQTLLLISVLDKLKPIFQTCS